MAIPRQPCDDAVVRSAPEVPACPERVRRGVLVAAIIGSSMTFVDGTVVNVALPVLRERLAASPAQAQWIVEAYMLLLTSLMLVGGALGDRWGRRFVFVLGIIVFAGASAWCGLTGSVSQLIAARAVQGAGAALLVPGSLALISATFTKATRGQAIGTWAAFTAVAAGAGPLAGGWLVETVSWRWIFLLNLPLAALVLVIVWLRVPESRGDVQAGRVDWLGASLATIALFCLVFGLVEAGSDGFAAPRVYFTLALGAAALAAFAAVEKRAPHPMLPLSLFASRTFTGANVLTLFLYAALGATLFVLPFYLIETRGYSVVRAAAALTPFVVVMTLLSRRSGWVMDRYGPRLPLTAGPVVASAGFFLFLLASSGGSYWTSIFPAVMVMSLGMTATVAPLTTTVMTSVSEGRAGLASGINNAVSRLASLLAVAVVGIVAAGSFRNGLPAVAILSGSLALAGAAGAWLLVRSEDVVDTNTA